MYVLWSLHFHHIKLTSDTVSFSPSFSLPLFPFVMCRITDIKYNSPAHTSGKIEDGDEIVQINYQTVIGWQYKKVIQQLQESGPDVLLTLKKRPKHTKIYGQIYMKPYRLPSKKKTIPYRLFENLPSPRIDLIPSRNFPMPLPLARVPEKQHLTDDSDSSCSDLLTPTEPPPKVPEKELRLYLPKPRTVLQRRNTICGDRASGYKGNIVFWHETRGQMDPQDSPSLRDKSVSFGFGLDVTARPTTCIGIQNVNAPIGRLADFGPNFKGSMPRMNSRKKIDAENEMENSNDVLELAKPPGPKPGISKVVRFDANNKNDLKTDNEFTCQIDTTIVKTFEPIPYVDDDDDVQSPMIQHVMATNHSVSKNGGDYESEAGSSSVKTLAEAVNVTLVNHTAERRGILEKSRSEPAYDGEHFSTDSSCDGSDSGIKIKLFYTKSKANYNFPILNIDTPPAIGPRKDFINKTPPVPPRPRKSIDSSPLSITSQQSPLSSSQSCTAMPQKSNSILMSTDLPPVDENSNKSKLANVIELKKRDQPPTPITPARIPKSYSTDNVVQKASVPVPATKHFLEDCFEELELVTPPKTKNLTLKKKNSLLAKRRKISLKALDISEIQGHLYRRTKDKNGVTYWAKLYFVLVETALYGFQAKESSKANCLIFLSGFTVSTATEVHSKQFAFKVYHRMKTFYFAAETQQALNQWMDYIKRATLKGNMATIDLDMNPNPKDLYSETESSDEDLDLGTSKFYSPLLTAKSGTNLNLLGCTGKKQHDDQASATTTKTEKYHLGFGSLKKFTKNNLPFTNKGDKEKEKKEKLSSDVPQPTAQFRSYRKVPGSAGMQLGTTSMINSDLIAGLPTNPFDTVTHATVQPLSENSPMATKASENMRKNSISSLSLTHSTSTASLVSAVPSVIASNMTVPPTSSTPPVPPATIESPPATLIVQQPATPAPISPLAEPMDEPPLTPSKPTSLRDIKKQKSRMTNKMSPYNYIHASNPNLVEFTFQTSKTLDLTFPKINASDMIGTPHNLQGFVTLKDLMLQKQEEERQDVYNNRVNMGMERDKSNRRRAMVDMSYSHQFDDDVNPAKQNLSKIQSRSLPKTPDYAQSFKPDDSDIIMARTKEGQKLRDFGYEFITGDDANGIIIGDSAANKKKSPYGHEISARLNDRDRLMIAAIGAGNSVSVSKKKAMNWMHTSNDSANRKTDDEKGSAGRSAGGSFKKTRTKLVAETFENFKSNSEKLFHFKYGNSHHSHGNNDRDTDSKQKIVMEKASPIKSSASYSPLTLPLNRKASHLVQMNINCPNNGAGSSQMRKSHTTNEMREPLERKLSAPIERTAAYFQKLSFSGSKTPKERKLLGSPRLHRAIFGRRDVDHQQPIDHEVFSPIEHIDAARPPPIQPRQFVDHGDGNAAVSFYGANSSSNSGPIPPVVPPKPQTITPAPSLATDYAHLEYPPTFEPETYSLCDPNASMTLLRRRHPQSKQNGK